MTTAQYASASDEGGWARRGSSGDADSPTMGVVPMRTDCKHYESRTYPSGDSVRKCNLDLAPEAPWRCPENCPAFARRLVDAGWSYGSLLSKTAPSEPAGLDRGAAAVLDEAEEVVNAVGPEILDEFRQLSSRRRKGWWRRVFRPR